MLGLLPDDNTFGRGSMYMLEPGTQCVVFDLDGTLTTSDAHVVAQVISACIQPAQSAHYLYFHRDSSNVLSAAFC